MLDWMEVSLRTLLAVSVLFVMTRLLGKRQISQLSLFEYITGITIGNLAAYISLDTEATWYLGVISLSVWVAVSLALEFLSMKSKKLREFVDGKALVVVKDGKILEKNLKKANYTTDDLTEMLRAKNVFAAADVEFAILESDGQLNVLQKEENLPLTARKLGIKLPRKRPTATVITDGNVMDEALATLGFTRGWLNSELEKAGVTVENVFLAEVDEAGQLFLDLYDDKLTPPEPQLKASLLALMKKCEADLELFSLSVEAQQAKDMYAQAAGQLQQVIDQTRPYLRK